jgi:hypothetical protein
MFIIGHEVGGTEEVPEVSFDIVGSTGNLYKTTIKRDPYCDCPDGAKGNQCKHICYGKYSTRTLVLGSHYPINHYHYSKRSRSLPLLIITEVLVHALKAPLHLQYQLAFLSSVRSTEHL